MDNKEFNVENYVTLDKVYSDFESRIDFIPMFITKEDIEVFYVSGIEYIKTEDYLKLKKLFTNTRLSGEIVIERKEKSSLIGFSVTN